MRHLSSGEDCAIAGEANAAAAAPVAETFKKSRRFIEGISLLGRSSQISRSGCPGEAVSASAEGALKGALARKAGRRKRDKGMTAPMTRKSQSVLKPAHATA